MNVKAKYLKDEAGDVVSPITSAKSIYSEGQNNLQDIISKNIYDRVTLYSGKATGNFNLSEDVKNFNYITVHFYMYYDYNITQLFQIGTDLEFALYRMVIVKSASTWFGGTGYLKIDEKNGTSVTFTGNGYNNWNSSYTDNSEIVIQQIDGFKLLS